MSPLSEISPDSGVKYRDIFPQKGSQLQMLTSPAEELFFGGESGGGKSFGFLLDFLEDKDNYRANGIFLRRHYPDLEGTIHDAIDLYSGFGADYNGSTHTFTFPSDTHPHGAQLRMRHMNNLKAVYGYTGKNWTHEYWDELPQFPMLAYLLLTVWLRSPDPTIFKRIRASGNPDGEHLAWVKDRFPDKLEPMEIGHFLRRNDRDIRVKYGTPGAMSRQFIPCFREENLALMMNDPGYRDRLEGLPEHLKRAYKHGLWDTIDAPFQLVKSKWWDAAINGKNAPKAGLACIGADYAPNMDRCAIAQGLGNQVRKFEEFPYGSITTNPDVPEYAKMIHERAKTIAERHGEGAVRIGIDANGVGVGAYHALRRTKFVGKVDPVMYKDKQYEAISKTGVRMKFNNLRSQMAWKLREDFADGDIDMRLLQSSPEGFYENLHLLKEEAMAHTYKIVAGVVSIVSKDELRKPEKLNRSPDRFDALMIWNWMRRGRVNERKPAVKSLQQHLDDLKARKEQTARVLSGAPSGLEGGNPDDWMRY